MSLSKPPEPQPRSGPLGPVVGGEKQMEDRPAELVRGYVWRVWNGHRWLYETRDYPAVEPGARA